MGMVQSDEGCSVCGLRGKPMDTPGMRCTTQMRSTSPPSVRLATTMRLAPPPALWLSASDPRPNLLASPMPCSTPLPLLPSDYGPAIHAEPIGSPVAPFGGNSHNGISESQEDDWDSKSNCASNSGYNALLENARARLMKTQQQAHGRASRPSLKLDLAGLSASGKRSTLASQSAQVGPAADARDSTSEQSALDNGRSEKLDDAPRVKSMVSEHSTLWERSPTNISEDQLTDFHYDEMRVSDRVRLYKSTLNVKPLARRHSGWSSLTRSNGNAAAPARKEVQEYQDAMKRRLGRYSSRATDFRRTRDPAAAVKEGVVRYYETCGDVGTLEPELLAENPDVEYVLRPEERELLESNVACLQERV